VGRGWTRSSLARREFLWRGALAGLGLGLLPLARPSGAEADAAPRVRRRVRLGRTGLEIPDVGFGGSRLRGDEDLVRYALDRGITYFDTAESYTGGSSEETIGRALVGRRDEVVLASKVVTEPADPPRKLMAALEGSLRRLRTDRIDVYFNHAVNDPARLDEAWVEFCSRAREQGKIRFTGVSGHGGRLVECLERALDEDMTDVILAAHNFGQDERFWERYTRGMDFVARQPDLPPVLTRAAKKGVGVVAMKTLMGGRLNDLRPYEKPGSTYAQAALRWTLSQPHTDALVVTMRSREQIDEYLGASGWTRPKRADQALLGAYLERNSRRHCRHGCATCEAACPAGVPVSEVLRTRMYAEDYCDPELAREEYARLDARAAACLACTARPCAGACPHGLPVDQLTKHTHRLLG
jgi:predicted aldo/keto reductase-like oxidoreductase